MFGQLFGEFYRIRRRGSFTAREGDRIPNEHLDGLMLDHELQDASNMLLRVRDALHRFDRRGEDAVRIASGDPDSGGANVQGETNSGRH